MSKTKRRKNKEYWDKRRRSRPQEKNPGEPQNLTGQPESRPQQGLRLPSTPTQGQKYLMETEDGMLVPVSEENLNEWSEAQKNAASEPLNKGEEHLLDKILELLYGKEEK